MHSSRYSESMDDPHLPWERDDHRAPISSRIAAATARQIIEQEYESGDLITEADVAAREGASRTPAREAMLQLERWGLLRLLPKKGAVVTAVNPVERRELLSLRIMFEIDAVSHLGDSSSLPEIAEGFDRDLNRQRRALDDDDYLEFASADFAFHARVIRSGGNRVIASLLDDLAPRLARLTYDVATQNPDRLATLLTEHTDLAHSARRGDAERFADQVRAHIHGGHFSTTS